MGDSGPIKIGQSDSPTLRMSQLQTANPAKLRMLWIYEGSGYTEVEIHDLFKSDRIRGEWFKPSEDLISFIKTTLMNDYTVNLVDGDVVSIFHFFDGRVGISTSHGNIIFDGDSQIVNGKKI